MISTLVRSVGVSRVKHVGTRATLIDKAVIGGHVFRLHVMDHVFLGATLEIADQAGPLVVRRLRHARHNHSRQKFVLVYEKKVNNMNTGFPIILFNPMAKMNLSGKVYELNELLMPLTIPLSYSLYSLNSLKLYFRERGYKILNRR